MASHTQTLSTCSVLPVSALICISRLAFRRPLLAPNVQMAAPVVEVLTSRGPAANPPCEKSQLVFWVSLHRRPMTRENDFSLAAMDHESVAVATRVGGRS